MYRQGQLVIKNIEWLACQKIMKTMSVKVTYQENFGFTTTAIIHIWLLIDLTDMNFDMLLQ